MLSQVSQPPSHAAPTSAASAMTGPDGDTGEDVD